jgi:DNA-binding beta-propeller fold protein YncE
MPDEDPPPPADDLPATGEHDVFADDHEDDGADEDDGSARGEDPASEPPAQGSGGAAPTWSAAHLWTNPQSPEVGGRSDPPSARSGGESEAPEEPGSPSAGDEAEEPDEPDSPARDGEDTLPTYPSRRREGAPRGEDGDEDEYDDELPGDEALAAHGPDFFPTGHEHTAEEIHARRLAAHRRHRRNGRIRLLAVIVVLALVITFVVDRLGGTSHPAKPAHTSSSPVAAAGKGPGYLLKGSQTSVLPGNLLIADRGNDRLVVISPQGQIVWQYPQAGTTVTPGLYPDFAFFTPSGHEITITEDGFSVISALDVGLAQSVFSYGQFNVGGAGVDRLFDPSAALRLGKGQILAADAGNCRVLVITPPNHAVTRQIGKTGRCTHDPPTTLAEPTTAFPIADDGIVVNEMRGGYADLFSHTGKLIDSLKIPGFDHTSATAQASSGVLISVEHRHPGAVETFSTAGKLIWRYDPTQGARELDDPSLAFVLPDGDVLVSDSLNDRVIVIDPKNDQIVWQYGVRHHSGAGAGYLNLPIGIDLVAPYSLLDAFPAAKPPA